MTEPRPEAAWLDEVRSAAARGDSAEAQRVLECALAEFPDSYELRRSRAGLYQQAGRTDAAERLLAELLAEVPSDAGTAFALARLQAAQDRTAAAAAALRSCFVAPVNAADPDLAIQAIELLSDLDRQRDAAAVAEAALVTTPHDARLHAYAGMLAIQLGDFTLARERLSFAIAHDLHAYEWHVPIGLSHTVRYTDGAHSDLALFKRGLTRADLSTLARAELHFALGKAADDYGDYAAAATQFHSGNALRQTISHWSRKSWRRAIEARLSARLPPPNAHPDRTFAPIFIVGMPRTGTTLLAELLSRFPGVCNRGELTALGRIAGRLETGSALTAEMMQRSAAQYARCARQDDASGAEWFIDKQPLNFRYVDVALAMFPHAHVLHCQRNGRDVALSLWMQCFLDNLQEYAYDFAGIATVLRDEARLMLHWQRHHLESIHSVRYEELVQTPDAIVTSIARWLGLPKTKGHPTTFPRSTDAIKTASVWQARQPVNTSSIGRWKRYASLIPELLKIPE